MHQQCPHPPLGARCSKESLAAAAAPGAAPVADRRLTFSSIRTLREHRMVTHGISFRWQAAASAPDGYVRKQLSGAMWASSTALCQGSSELQNIPAPPSCQNAMWCLPAPLPQVSWQQCQMRKAAETIVQRKITVLLPTEEGSHPVCMALHAKQAQGRAHCSRPVLLPQILQEAPDLPIHLCCILRTHRNGDGHHRGWRSGHSLAQL